MFLDSILNALFEKHMEIWRRKHGVMFEEGFSVSKVTIGNDTYVSHLAVMNPFKDSPIRIGNNCTVKEFCVFRGNLVIGNNVRIACHTIIITTRNNYKDQSTPIWLQGFSSKGVVIEDDVWIGAGVIILDGCVIHKGSVIGAGSVLPQDTVIPEYSVVAGNPCRIIKKRCEEELVQI